MQLTELRPPDPESKEKLRSSDFSIEIIDFDWLIYTNVRMTIPFSLSMRSRTLCLVVVFALALVFAFALPSSLARSLIEIPAEIK